MSKVYELAENVNVPKYCCKNDDELTKVFITNHADIEEEAFAWCTSLKEIVLDVKNIGKGAFACCLSINDCMLKNVESISEEAFVSCEGIRDLRLGSKIKSIGKNAFFGCKPTMICCSQEIYDKYISDDKGELDMTYLFGRSGKNSYHIDNSFNKLFIEHYDVIIVENL